MSSGAGDIGKTAMTFGKAALSSLGSLSYQVTEELIAALVSLAQQTKDVVDAGDDYCVEVLVGLELLEHGVGTEDDAKSTASKCFEHLEAIDAARKKNIKARKLGQQPDQVSVFTA